MPVCDVIPQIRKGDRTVTSQLFPELQKLVPDDRSAAKAMYGQVFSPNFMGWFGDWSEGMRKVAVVSDLFDRNQRLATHVYDSLGARTQLDKIRAQEVFGAYLESLGTQQEVVTRAFGATDFRAINQDLAESLESKLRETYPDIKLTFSNNPVWAEGDNVYNQESERISKINYRHKMFIDLQSQRAQQIFQQGIKQGLSHTEIFTKIGLPKIVADSLGELKPDTLQQAIELIATEYAPPVYVRYRNVIPDYENPRYHEDPTWGGVDVTYEPYNVPGGIVYLEAEIGTDFHVTVIPHVNFYTKGNMGWFRSDTDVQGLIDREGIPVEPERFAREIDQNTGEPIDIDWIEYHQAAQQATGTTRRVLEVQSDLFQKGRKKDFWGLRFINEFQSRDGRTYQVDHDISDVGSFVQLMEEDRPISIGRPEGVRFRFSDPETGRIYRRSQLPPDVHQFAKGYREYINKGKVLPENTFLGLLFRKDKWAEFMVKSVIQDSARKGFTRVKFPRGDTAALIQKHETVQTAANQIRSNIELYEKGVFDRGELLLPNSPIQVTNHAEYQGNHVVRESDRHSDEDRIFSDDAGNTYYYDWHIDDAFTMANAEGIVQQITQDQYFEQLHIVESVEGSLERTIQYERNRLAYLEQSAERSLSPVHEFYEKTVKKILDKGNYKPEITKDTHDNEWYEIQIDSSRDLSDVLLQRNEADQIIGQANIQAMTVLIDALNQKQDTLPHEYAHHYIAWFRDSEIVQEGIKRFGSEEALVQAIGEQVVKQEGEALNWWQEFMTWVLNLLSDQQVLQILTDSFLENVNLSEQFAYNTQTMSEHIQGFREFAQTHESNRLQEGPSQLRSQTGEPVLLSPVTDSPLYLATAVPFIDARNKGYGKGVYLGPANGDKLQAGFAKMLFPVRQGEVDSGRLYAILNERLGAVLPKEMSHRLDKIATMPLKEATKALERLVKDAEYEAGRDIWTPIQDVRNVWEIFGYDGIIDGDTHVLFSPFNYWSVWNNEQARDTQERTHTPPENDIVEPDKATVRKELLQKKFNAEVVYTTDLPEGTVARVRRDGDRPVIEVHPERIQSDSLYHEFAHIFIDGIGGLNNPQVKRGVDLLQGTELWNRVAQEYSHLSESMLAKEVLAQAMGREINELMISDQNLLGQIRNWLTLLFERIRKVFGLQTNVIRDLSLQVLSDQVSPEFDIGRMPTEYQEQRKRMDRNTRLFNKKLQLYEDMFERMAQRVGQLKERGGKMAARELEKLRKELQKDLDRKVGYAGLLRYRNQAYQDLDYLYTELYNRVQNGTLTPSQLIHIRNAADTYGSIESVARLLEQDPAMAKELGADFSLDIDYLRGVLEKIEHIWQDESFEFATDMLQGRVIPAVGVRRKRAEIRERFRKDFRKKYNKKRDYKGREEQFKIDEEAYIARRMETDKAKVDAEIENDVREQLKLAQQDIGSVESWMTAMKNMDHEILQVVAEAVDYQEARVIRDTFELERELHKVMEPLREYKGRPADPAVLYEDVLELGPDGKLTGYLVAKYSAEFEALEKKFFEDNRNLMKTDYDGWVLAKEKFYSENGKVNPEILEWEERRADAKKRLRKSEYENWEAENPPPREYLPADKFLNRQYNKLDKNHSSYLGDNNPSVKFYNFVIQQLKRFDDMIPNESKRLGYMLPSIRKALVERMITGDLQGLLDNAKAAFFWTADDTTQGEIITETNEKGEKVYVRKDAKGKRIESIPIHYRAELDPKHRSFDVATLLVLNAHMSMNFAYKNQILPEIQMIQEQLRTRRVGQFKGGKQQMMKDSKNHPYTIHGELSKGYRALEDFMDFRLFGRHTTERDPFVDHAKKFGQVMSYTGMILLGGNILAAVANVALGESLFLAEAAGGKYLGGGDWKAAQGYYARNMANGEILSDVGKHRYEAKVNLLMKQYDALNTYRPWSHKFADKNRMMRLFRQHNIYFLNNIGEHRMHTMTLFALLNRTKAANEKGQWIDSEGKVTQDGSKAATMLEMYEAKDGELVLDSRVKKVEWDGQYFEPGFDLEFRITQRMRQLNEYMHGAYADQNSNHLQRYTIGRLAIMMRKWIEPGVRRRFNGIKRVYYGQKGMRWDHQLNDFHEGTATTVIRWFAESWKDKETFITSLQMHWSEMNDIERANVHRMVVEAGIMAVSLTFASIMYGIARDTEDEDEANRYWYMGYQANRLFSEMFFYYPPFNIAEAYRVLKSPAATIAVYERSTRLIKQTMDPLDRYESGRRRGDLKIGKYALDMVPFYNPIDRVRNMADLVNIVYN